MMDRLMEIIAMEEAKYKPPAGPKELAKYYGPCRSGGQSKEYCARVAWNVYCANVNPDYKGCTEFGKTWGEPYSAPTGGK